MNQLRGMAALLGITALAACGGAATKDEGDATTGDTGATTAAATTGSGATSGTTSGGGQQCGAGSVDMDDPCEVCVLENCAPEALACCQQTGCLDIIACAQETGCSGVDCYTPETCQAAIDAAGGITIATMFAQPLGNCAIASCATTCGAMGAGGGGP